MSEPQPQRGGLQASITVDVLNVPEVVAAARCELARLLREAAADEGPEVAAFAHRVAALFEAGQEEDT